MGWFKLPGSDAIVGDDPADLMQDALPAYAQRHGRPTFEAFLDALATVLAGDTAELLDGPGLPPSDRLRARFRGGAPDVVSSANDPDQMLVRAVSDALADVAGSYVQGQGRRPRLDEVLGTVVFSFGRRLSEYFAGCDGLTLQELVHEHG